MDIDLGLECPECGQPLRATTKDVAQQKTVTCRSGHQVKLQDSGGGARKVQKSLDDLDKAIKRLGR